MIEDMIKSFSLVALLTLVALAAPVLADEEPTDRGPMTASEQAFASTMAADLMARFPTAADAEKAGYVRYTSEDDTGAISYADLQWQSNDIRHPSQLWYDKNGRLLGADFSVLVSTSPKRPQLWGVDPGRWSEFNGHIHWVSKDAATGAIVYDGWMWDKNFAAGGGDPQHPNATMLVAMKKVPAADDVVTVFHFPAIWDLIVWVKPNPNGAFAWKNPSVKP